MLRAEDMIVKIKQEAVITINERIPSRGHKSTNPIGNKAKVQIMIKIAE